MQINLVRTIQLEVIWSYAKQLGDHVSLKSVHHRQTICLRISRAFNLKSVDRTQKICLRIPRAFSFKSVDHTQTICSRIPRAFSSWSYGDNLFEDLQRHSAWSQLTTHKHLNPTWSQSNLTKTDRIYKKVDFSDETLYRSMPILTDFRKCWLHPCGFLFDFFAKNSVLSICSTPW